MNIDDENLSAAETFSALLNCDGPLFSAKEIEIFAKDSGLDRHQAFLLLTAAALGRERDRRFVARYLSPAVSMLNKDTYAANPYLQSIRFPAKRLGRWQLKEMAFEPYQLIPAGHMRLLPDGREIPALGYLDQPFPYPAVLENGREWMTVTPNEIETMAASIAAAQGNIAVFGLGLGYFAFRAAQKQQVAAVTVIERDRDVIDLFRSELLPQFPHKEKIRIVPCDAFDFVKSMGTGDPFDFAFVDLWHDVGDGLPMYLRFRALERLSPATAFHYWIEQDMLIFLRGLMIEDHRQGAGPLKDLLPGGTEDWTLERVRRAALQIPPENVLPSSGSH